VVWFTIASFRLAGIASNRACGAGRAEIERERFMIRAAILAGVCVIGAGVALAQGNVIEERQAAMKAIGGAAQPAVAMLRGQAPFDQAAAQAAFRAMAEHTRKAKDMFPDGSLDGSRAMPAVWENKADFDARMSKLADAADAAGQKVSDLASLKATLPGVMANCGACHTTYRAPSR